MRLDNGLELVVGNLVLLENGLRAKVYNIHNEANLNFSLRVYDDRGTETYTVDYCNGIADCGYAESEPDYDASYVNKHTIVELLSGMDDPKYTERKQKKVTSKQLLMTNFAEADLPKAVEMITCGFELETQKSDDMTRRDADQKIPKLAEDAAKKQLPEVLKDWKRLSQYVNYFRNFITAVPEAKREGLVKMLELESAEKIADYFNLKMAQLETEVKQRLRDTLQNNGYGLIFPKLLEKGILVKMDGSVNGFEFTSGVKGATVKEFIDQLEELTKVKHTVDENCSFHIHMSVNGIEHKYGRRMQQAMYEYLLIHAWDEVPYSVKRRWQHQAIEQYAKCIINGPNDQATEKYRFISYRGKTWEFRCFGNINKLEDGAQCLELAMKAMQHAYKVLLGKETLQINGVSDFTPLLKSNREDWLRRMKQETEAA